MARHLVSIVLPVHNQADHVEGIVRAYEAALARVGEPDHELILVPNNCTDRSVDLCLGLAAAHPSVRVAPTERGGWGHAVRIGLQEAKGDFLCYTNSARTAPADLVLLVLYALANPGAVVKAHRRSRDSFTRRLGSFLYNLEVRGLFDLPAWDINATPKVFSREIYEAIDLTSAGDLIDLEFYVKCKRLGALILEVPIYSGTRHGGVSTTSLRSAARMYWGAFRMWRSLRARPPAA